MFSMKHIFTIHQLSNSLSDARLSLLVSEDTTTSSWVGAAAAAQLARSKSAEALSSDQDAEEVGNCLRLDDLIVFMNGWTRDIFNASELCIEEALLQAIHFIGETLNFLEWARRK